jgi:hypothetical protein
MPYLICDAHCLKEAGMTVELGTEEVDILLESVEYSKQPIRDAQDTPYAIRQDRLKRLDTVAAKLRGARTSL